MDTMQTTSITVSWRAGQPTLFVSDSNKNLALNDVHHAIFCIYIKITPTIMLVTGCSWRWDMRLIHDVHRPC